MMTVVVKANELEAVSLFSSKDESRYVLNGVYVQSRPGKAPLLVATDGRRLGLVASVAEQPNEQVEFSAVISSRAVARAIRLAKEEMVKSGKKRPDSHDVEFTVVPQPVGIPSLNMTVWDTTVTMLKGLVDGSFPKWEHVIPCQGAEKREWVCVNPRYLEVYRKVSTLLVGNKAEAIRLVFFQVKPAGSECGPIGIWISGADNFYSVMMPVRSYTEEVGAPKWVREIVEKKEPAAAKEEKKEAVNG